MNDHHDRVQSNGSLPADRAFVIQFHPTASDGSVRCQGRVEHLASGRAESFLSREELWQVLKRLLIERSK